jgi:hypothetical protein
MSFANSIPEPITTGIWAQFQKHMNVWVELQIITGVIGLFQQK